MVHEIVVRKRRELGHHPVYELLAGTENNFFCRVQNGGVTRVTLREPTFALGSSRVGDGPGARVPWTVCYLYGA